MSRRVSQGISRTAYNQRGICVVALLRFEDGVVSGVAPALGSFRSVHLFCCPRNADWTSCFSATMQRQRVVGQLLRAARADCGKPRLGERCRRGGGFALRVSRGRSRDRANAGNLDRCRMVHHRRTASLIFLELAHSLSAPSSDRNNSAASGALLPRILPDHRAPARRSQG